MDSRRGTPKNGKYLYNVIPREPFKLPDEKIHLPAPPQAPGQPPQINLLMVLLPPLLMMGSMLLGQYLVRKFSNNPSSTMLYTMIPMALMGLGFPLANLFSTLALKRKYKKNLVQREANYKKTLLEVEKVIKKAIVIQREIMEREFPNAGMTQRIGLGRGQSPRLWWRRPGDPDFLMLRVGTGDSEPSFEIELPNLNLENEPLAKLPIELKEQFRVIDHIPTLVDLKRVGSLIINSPDRVLTLRMARRVAVDLCVHQSPNDLSLFLVSDQPKAGETWEWMRWFPHTGSFDGESGGRNMLMDADRINNFLDDLKQIMTDRSAANRNQGEPNLAAMMPAIVVFLDDKGTIRQHPDVGRLAGEGYLYGIYLIFISSGGVPRTTRSRIEIVSTEKMAYLETIEALGTGQRKTSKPEFLTGDQSIAVGRALSSLEVAGSTRTESLPSVVRISDILPGDIFSVQDVISTWNENRKDSNQVVFPVGQWVDRTGLATYEIDFRPENLGGLGTYHAMMIGTTGSGKSIFMQSLVLAAAYKYSPKELNFMFMDFKAGAAELKKVNDLPHSVGMVTDLGPTLADRALKALENEVARRKVVFDSAGKVTDIWDFNRRFSNQAFPHLLVVVDEFAEGIKVLPNLVERLRELGRQGRAFGIYFLLANQEVNSAVEDLKANVGWYILLRVNRLEEMSLIGRNFAIPSGRGHGYIKVKSEVTTIRGAYAGLPANAGNQAENEIEEYSIYQFCPDGQRNQLYHYYPHQDSKSKASFTTELDAIVSLISDACKTLSIPHASPIYLEPLDEKIPISMVLQHTDTHKLFNGEVWVQGAADKNTVPLGFLDLPDKCLQTTFAYDFNDNGGHLWIVGAPGSGKTDVILSLVFSLCMTHTPEEMQFYVLEFGSGNLSRLESFPHCGGVIRQNDAERINRLLNYLKLELSARSEPLGYSASLPHIYVFLNNVADFKNQYPDQFDELGRFVRSGGAVGIHLILSTNRGSELSRSLSGNIPARIVLQLAERQEYGDVLGTIAVPPLPKSPGRGFLQVDGIVECQVAQPDMGIFGETPDAEATPQKTGKESGLEQQLAVADKVADRMNAAWKGERPKLIQAMPEVLEFGQFVASVEQERFGQPAFSLPIGISYETLSTIWVNPQAELQFWTITGKKKSGKTNLLASLYIQALKSQPAWSVTYFAMKREPIVENRIAELGGKMHFAQPEIAFQAEEFLKRVQEEPDQFNLLLIDDVGSPYSSNNTAMISTLDQLGDQLSRLSNKNFLVVIADLAANLKGGAAYLSPLLKVCQQNQTGFLLSADDNDLTYFSLRMTLQQRKDYPETIGRGFFVRKSAFTYLQLPLILKD
jgi:S-DNA-T family DNA segregation ATPase FtsK/SpoIIIE